MHNSRTRLPPRVSMKPRSTSVERNQTRGMQRRERERREREAAGEARTSEKAICSRGDSNIDPIPLLTPSEHHLLDPTGGGVCRDHVSAQKAEPEARSSHIRGSKTRARSLS